ncbi:DUF3604 domain-containing protein [Myxococcota bacterium]|nr:DUF3604 domain-containing protein [Myxococcota bacterium]
MKNSNLWIATAALLTLLGCTSSDNNISTDPDSEFAQNLRRAVNSNPLEIDDDVITVRPRPNPERNAYFGDLHVHTTYSMDAFAFGTIATPYDAYRYARGEAIQHPGGFDMQLRKPLDFYAVTDHAMFLGVVQAAADTSTETSKLPFSKNIHDLNAPENLGVTSIPGRVQTFATFLPAMIQGIQDGSIDPEALEEVTRSAWADTINAAERFNDPGRFTTFVAYEYTTSSDDQGNLHRNVIFRGGDQFPAVPFSRFHSRNPEGLWDWMDGLRARGIESLAIPHNSNGSNGQMFKMEDWAGNPIDDDYATQRLRNEPLVEITQVKGTSETHPLLSQTDEWADFEIMPYRIASPEFSKPEGSYVRDALRRGLTLEDRGVENPYKFGVVGASDTHTGATSDDESNYFSKIGLLDATSERRGSTPLPWWQATLLNYAQPNMIAEVEGETYMSGATPTWGASGLAAVWAEENTREAIYDAFRRKETFATTGPRIRVRFFAGYDFPTNILESPDLATLAYRSGVTMGSDLIGDGAQAPEFLAWAIRDSDGAPLQRLQVIKGWVEEGETFEEVYDIACSDGALPDPKTHRCPDNGAKVDLSDCSISSNVGASELKALWRDPQFDPDQKAFYYVRVLENPTCRWSTWDAIRAGLEPRPDLKKTIQERAWSSAIWYVPDETGDTAES